MRISDWSSDVCSSDLDRVAHAERAQPADRGECGESAAEDDDVLHGRCSRAQRAISAAGSAPDTRAISRPPWNSTSVGMLRMPKRAPSSGSRSEEHTSELQSLMRISYAVFCLKK